MIEAGDVRWLAGLVEGEGCFLRAKDGAVKLQIGMTDRDVIERAADLLGSRVYEYEKASPRKRIYTAVVSGPRAAGWMMTLYSLMGLRRKAKIAEILGQWRLQSRKQDSCRKGHPLSGENLYQYTNRQGALGGRGCRTCRNVSSAERMRRIRSVPANRDEINSRQRAAYHAFIGPRRPPGRHKEA